MLPRTWKVTDYVQFVVLAGYTRQLTMAPKG